MSACMLFFTEQACALNSSGLIHRWSFNIGLEASVGGVSAEAVGSVSIDNGSCLLPGGEKDNDTFPPAYIVLPNVIPADATELTIELWTEMLARYARAQIIQIGQNSPLFVQAIRKGTGLNCDVIGIPGVSQDIDLTPSYLAPFELGVLYHLAIVMKRQSDGRWKFMLYKQRMGDGATLRKVEFISDTTWSLSDFGMSDVMLGYYGDHEWTDGKYSAKARYGEVRIWKRALEEGELAESVRAGQDVDFSTYKPSGRVYFPYITNVVAKQRYPWNGKVDVSYEVVGDIRAYCENEGYNADEIGIKIEAIDKTQLYTYYETTNVLGASMSEGSHAVVWDMRADGLDIVSQNVQFRVSVDGPQYCIVDLSLDEYGLTRNYYPVRFTIGRPRGGWTDEYKTTKLVLRRIASNKFEMGGSRKYADPYQNGNTTYTKVITCESNPSHTVLLSKDYFIGIFELTQKQWNLVMSSAFAPYYDGGDQKPVFSRSCKTLICDFATAA